jgi:hypothetical protein
MRRLSRSSYGDVPPQPAWLRRAQIAALTGMLIAMTVMFCRLAFGMWQHQVWPDIVALTLESAFIGTQIAVIRWNRSLKAK